MVHLHIVGNLHLDVIMTKKIISVDIFEALKDFSLLNNKSGMGVELSE